MRSLESSELKLVSGGSSVVGYGVALGAVIGIYLLPFYYFAQSREAELAVANDVANLIAANFNETMLMLSDTQQESINAYITHREGLANNLGYLEGMRSW